MILYHISHNISKMKKCDCTYHIIFSEKLVVRLLLIQSQLKHERRVKRFINCHVIRWPDRIISDDSIPRTIREIIVV